MTPGQFHARLVASGRPRRRGAGGLVLPDSFPHRLRNGNLFYHHVDFRSVEIDLCGNVVRSFYADKRSFGPADDPAAIPVDAQSLHHQPREMPNGNYLALTANAREIENHYTSETDPDTARKVVGDKIVEFTPEGEIV